MRLAHPKSFIAGLLLLSFVVWSLFGALHQAHASALYKYNLIASPILAALCFWHAFLGKWPMFDKSELRTSLWLGLLSLLVGLGMTLARVLAWFKFHRPQWGIVLAALYIAAAVYYLRMAARERNSEVKTTALLG